MKIGDQLRLTQHKRFVPYSTHPNFCFAKTSFMLGTAELLGIIEATKAEVKAEITKMKLDFLRLDKRVTIMFTAIIFLIVFLNQNALEFIAKILGIVR